MQKILTYLGIYILILLRYLPLNILKHIGYTLGKILYILPSKRKKIVKENLSLCFPDKTKQQIDKLAYKCIQEVARSIIERSIVWFGSKQKILKLVDIYGKENLPLEGAILLGIHMAGIEAGGIAIACAYNPDDFISVYMPQKNKIFDKIIKQQRIRFGGLIFTKNNSAKHIINALNQNKYVQIFADMDFGIKDSIFSKFFNIPAATITSIPKLASLTHKKVVPIAPIFNPKKSKYEVYILPAFENYPSGNLQQDIDRLNQHFETIISKNIEQYWWVHRRFKTKPSKTNDL